MSNLHALMALVQDLVAEMDAGRFRAGFHRPLQRGSAHGSVDVLQDPEDGTQLLLVVRFAVIEVPGSNVEQFLATLLELNHRFQGRAAFSLSETGTVFLTAGRPVSDLDESEILDLIFWTSAQADHYDDILAETFPS